MMRGREAAALVAEAIGTFLFFFVGAGSIVLGDYLAANGGTGPGLLGVALAHGLALAVVVSSLGAVSGGHFNPAVTLAVWVMGKIPPVRAGLYIAAQLVGGLAAGLAQSRPVRNGPRRAIVQFQERRRAWKPLPLIEESDGRRSEAWFTRLLAWIAGVEPAADSLSGCCSNQ